MSIYEDAASVLSSLIELCANGVCPVGELDGSIRVLYKNKRVLNHLALTAFPAEFFEQWYSVKPTEEFGDYKYYTQQTLGEI